MTRIRTIKPEFWEDEAVGVLSREARLLFIATWNLADDEGLLRWSASFVKASVFMYDDDISVTECAGYMAELEEPGLIYPYRGGKSQQRLAYVVNFRKHQRINRPQPGKLPAPSLQNPDVRRMYARRDGWTCHLCQKSISETPSFDDRWNLSLDHLDCRVNGGSDYPSNIRASHQQCNKSRGSSPAPDVDQDSDEDRESFTESFSESGDALFPTPDVPRSLGEGKGREGEGKGGDTPTAPAKIAGSALAAISPETDNQRAQRLTKTYTDLVPMSRFPAVMGIVRQAIRSGYDDGTINAALTRLAHQGRPVTVDVLRIEIEGLPAVPGGSARKREGDRILEEAMWRAEAAERNAS